MSADNAYFDGLIRELSGYTGDISWNLRDSKRYSPDKADENASLLGHIKSVVERMEAHLYARSPYKLDLEITIQPEPSDKRCLCNACYAHFGLADGVERVPVLPGASCDWCDDLTGRPGYKPEGWESIDTSSDCPSISPVERLAKAVGCTEAEIAEIKADNALAYYESIG